MKYKTLILSLTFSLLLLNAAGLVRIDHQTAWAVEKDQAASQHAGHGTGRVHHQGIPFNYLLSWILTLMGFALGILAYRIAPQKGKHDHLDARRNTLAISIISLMLLTFLVDMFPPHGYHEAFFIGFIRLGIKLACGLLFLFFGLAYHYAHEHHDSHH